MNSMKLVAKIEQLLEEDRIDQEAALRLMLVTQKELLERMETVEQTTRTNSEYLAHYPSITWLWSNQRKSTILVIMIVFLILYFLFTPITISDIRHALLDSVGLPPDLGVGPVP